MNRLVTQVELPSDFIPYYITRCTKTCEDLEVNVGLNPGTNFRSGKQFERAQYHTLDSHRRCNFGPESLTSNLEVLGRLWPEMASANT